MKRILKCHFWVILSLVGMSFFLYSCASAVEEDLSEKTYNENQDDESGTPYSQVRLTDSQWNTLLWLNYFGSNYIQEVYKSTPNSENSNFFIGRYNIAMMLAMLANGADEESKKEISQYLGSEIEELNSFFEFATGLLKRSDNQVKFNSATSLWLSNNSSVNNGFVDLLKTYYDAEVYSRDLSAGSTKEEINQWYSNKTEGMIQEFLKNTLPPAVNMYAGNAVFFNGKWEIPFDKANTRKEIFHSSDGSETEVEMMHYKEQMMFYGEPEQGGKVIELSFGNGVYSIILYLPDPAMKIEDALPFLSSIDSYCFYYQKKVNLSLPKFSIRSRNDNVKDILSNMGCSGLFGSSTFSGLGALQLSSLSHEAVFELDESGAKAAAASGGIHVAHGTIRDYEKVIDLAFDRPFYFAITAHSNFILFSGIVNKL
ncbi:MAG: serpin family protein [Muribaculaceae bacterium]|nr:serpin family protein [Muribaculaceae bacterium]